MNAVCHDNDVRGQAPSCRGNQHASTICASNLRPELNVNAQLPRAIFQGGDDVLAGNAVTAAVTRNHGGTIVAVARLSPRYFHSTLEDTIANADRLQHFERVGLGGNGEPFGS